MNFLETHVSTMYALFATYAPPTCHMPTSLFRCIVKPYDKTLYVCMTDFSFKPWFISLLQDRNIFVSRHKVTQSALYKIVVQWPQGTLQEIPIVKGKSNPDYSYSQYRELGLRGACIKVSRNGVILVTRGNYVPRHRFDRGGATTLCHFPVFCLSSDAEDRL